MACPAKTTIMKTGGTPIEPPGARVEPVAGSFEATEHRWNGSHLAQLLGVSETLKKREYD
jgi:hypothetical protein